MGKHGIFSTCTCPCEGKGKRPTRRGMNKARGRHFPLREAATQHPARSVIIMGDLNAEPRLWVQEGNGVKHWANEKLDDICEQGWAPTIVDEATYASGTLI